MKTGIMERFVMLSNEVKSNEKGNICPSEGTVDLV